MDDALWVLLGFLAGGGVVLAVVVLRRAPVRDLVEQIVSAAQAEKAAEMDRIIAQLREAFAALSRDALTASKDDFLQLARTRLEQETGKGSQTLEEKKKLIDAALEAMQKRVTEVHATLQSLEKDRREAHGGLVREMQKTAQVTSTLQQTTAQLREALASPQRRGQWGERMAEDVLRAVGMVEGINYHKQASDGAGGRPDYVFSLPQGLRLNMDVKFPSTQYMEYLQAPDEPTAEARKRDFLRAVRDRVREVTRREYVNPAEGTVDYVLVFIPNEAIYAFIHQHDPDLLDEAIRQKVVLCSPLTLYAVLAVVRQSVENFKLAQVSDEVLRLLGTFRREWEKYVEATDKVGRSIETLVRAFGDLTTTRTRALQRQLDRVEDLCAQRLPAAPADPLPPDAAAPLTDSETR